MNKIKIVFTKSYLLLPSFILTYLGIVALEV